MASSKILLYKSKTYKDGSHPICLRLTFERKRSYITIAEVKPKFWDYESNFVKKSHPNAKGINRLIKIKDADAYDLLLDYDSGKSNYTREQIILKLKGGKRTETLPEYLNEYIEELKAKDKYSDAASKTAMKNNIVEFNHDNDDIRFATITVAWLRKLDLHLKKKKNGERTIFNYMNVIRTIYNRAITDGVISRDFYPFSTYKIKMPQSEKIGLDKKEVVAIIKLKITDSKTDAWELAKWTWLLSFAFGGMRTGDVLRMKWVDFKNEQFYYVMGKNNKPVSLPIPDLAKNALKYFKKYKPRSKGYVIPEICKANENDPKDIERKIKNANRWYNEQLKVVAEKAKIKKNLSMHIARHSFGNISGDKISPQLLQLIYRHSDIKTTMNYQQHWLNQEKLNKAITNVIDF